MARGKSDPLLHSDYMSSPRLNIGCAGWNIPKDYADRFPTLGSHLKRYSQVFPAVEINSSFYRPHKPDTYERWAQSAPEKFRFSVKTPRTITHFRKLKDIETELDNFLGECQHLGPKLGPLLVQLPPSLAYDALTVDNFFSTVRARFSGQIACEPRHPSWFADEPDEMFSGYQIARVAADPAIVPDAGEPGGWPGLVYYRLHGSPRIYYSTYEPGYIQSIVKRVLEANANGIDAWCIFDNTAEGEATGNALTVLEACGPNYNA